MSIQVHMPTGMKDDHYGNYRSSVEGKRTNNQRDWIRGYWENIGPNSIFIQDKYHLKRECEKHGVMAKAFMKRKSQGKGWEWNF